MLKGESEVIIMKKRENIEIFRNISQDFVLRTLLLECKCLLICSKFNKFITPEIRNEYSRAAPNSCNRALPILFLALDYGSQITQQ